MLLRAFHMIFSRLPMQFYVAVSQTSRLYQFVSMQRCFTTLAKFIVKEFAGKFQSASCVHPVSYCRLPGTLLASTPQFSTSSPERWKRQVMASARAVPHRPNHHTLRWKWIEKQPRRTGIAGGASSVQVKVTFEGRRHGMCELVLHFCFV